MKQIPVLALVALPQDIPEHQLFKGQLGTVVEHLERDGQDALLVEFSNEDGETIAMVPLRPEQILVLHKSNKAA